MEYFEDLALGLEAPIPFKEWKRYVDDVFSIISKGKREIMLQYLNSIDPHIKFTVEQPNIEGTIPFLDTFPNLMGRLLKFQCTGNLHTQTDTWTSTLVTLF